MEIINGVPQNDVALETLSAGSETVSEGFYAGTTLSTVDADLAAANIKKDVVIFGVTGTFTTTATPITASTVKTGLIGWAGGVQVTGAGTQTLSAANSTVNAGYYEATTLETVDTDLATGNIKAGTTIFGKLGTYVTPLTGDSVIANVLATKTFYKDDAATKLTGTMPNNAGDVASVSAHMDATTNLHVVPATGYTDGVDDATTVDLAVVDADLVTGNILAGITILGVAGAAAGDIALGKFAWVNGVRITGSHV
jgi:hypothetical protein